MSFDCSWPDSAVGGVLDLDELVPWPIDSSWPTMSIHHANSGTPRSLQKDLMDTGLALANNSNFGPSDVMDGRFPTRRTNHASTSMARATTSACIFQHGLPSASTSTQTPHSLTDNGKRGFHHFDMDHSASYTYGATPWPTTGMIATQYSPSAIRVYDPAEYCSRISNDSESGTVQFAAKKQRVDRFDESQLSSQSIHAPDLCLPSTHNVSPSTSMSTNPPSSSLTSSGTMSRQSSVTSASMIDDFDMLRVESSFSSVTDLFPFDDVNGPSVSNATEKLNSSHATIGLQDNSALQLLSNVGCGLGCADFPFRQNLSAAAVTAGRQQGTFNEGYLIEQVPDMERTFSEQSTTSSTSSSDCKASERRRKHIENGKQTIAPRSLPQGPTSTKPTTADAKLRPSKPQDHFFRRKEAIVKAPYVRPQHPKLYCPICTEFPGGFRGEHELRRHWDRAHAECRKVWICTEPTSRTEWWPAKPLGICKQCKQQKTYNVYYNAAAHLRRAHFCPRKRGRKAKGDKRESRAGKAGGDWPPIEWLKANGWLKEIEVTAEQILNAAVSHNPDLPAESSQEDVDTEYIQDFAIDPHQQALAAEALSLQAYPAMNDFSLMSYPFSAPMEHTVSAPPSLPTTTSTNNMHTSNNAFAPHGRNNDFVFLSGN